MLACTHSVLGWAWGLISLRVAACRHRVLVLAGDDALGFRGHGGIPVHTCDGCRRQLVFGALRPRLPT